MAAPPTVQKDLAMTFLGCGNLGTAVLSGLVESLSTPSSTGPFPEGREKLSFSRFIACVQRQESAERITKTLHKWSYPLTVLVGENLKGVEQGDVIILGCKPYAFKDVLSAPGIRQALDGKVLISILGGVTIQDIEEHLYGGTLSTRQTETARCTVVRAIPNVAAIVRESITVISEPQPPLPSFVAELTTFVFSCVGQVLWLPENLVDAGSTLGASVPAYFAMMLEAAAQGAIDNGVSRRNAVHVAACAMLGTAKMVLGGDDPENIRKKVATPGGCTMVGLNLLEERGVKPAISESVTQAIIAASKLRK